MKMRAKFELRRVIKQTGWEGETLQFSAVCGKPFGPDGESEDNTYARWTPSATLEMSVTNPELVGTFKPGTAFYVDFTEAPEPRPPSEVVLGGGQIPKNG